MIKERIFTVLGIWILLSPWILGFQSITVMKWNNVLVGLAISLSSAWSLFGRDREKIIT